MSDFKTIPLALYSSIVNYSGHDGFLLFCELEAFKKLNPNKPYYKFNTNPSYRFTNREDVWNKKIKKLIKMGLVEQKGDSYISKSKLNKWKEFQTKSFIKKLSGSLRIDLFELYSLRNKDYEFLRDYIYIGLMNSVVRGRNYSRKWIQEVTGFSPYIQKEIEKRNADKIIINKKLSVVNTVKSNQLEDKKVFPVHVDLKNKTITKTTMSNHNSLAVQQGNSSYVKQSYIFSFRSNKSNNKPSAFYNTQNTDIEVKANENYDAVFSEEKHKNVRSELFFSNQVYKNGVKNQLLKQLNFNNTPILDSKGNLNSLNNILTYC